jgi:CheY-like chemotaxis protein
MLVRPIEILLVEDNPGDVRLAIEALRDGKLANQLTVAGNGEEALARIRREPPYADTPTPDLILLDLNLPRRNGHEVLAALQADPELGRIPVVVLTASREEHDVLRSLHGGATGYMTKPVDFPQLLALVAEIETLHLSIVLPIGASS